MKIILITVLLMLTVNQSLAEFVFEIQVLSVRTSTTTNCGADDSTPYCETYLSIFCLREGRNTTSNDATDCPLGSANRTLVYYYETLPMRYIVSDQPWPETFQLYINAKDEDDNGDEDDDIDDIFITMELSADFRLPAIIDSYTGVEGNVTVELSIEVQCLENYYGADCFTFCVPQDDDQNGHFACNADDGTLLCLNGFQNPDNNCVDSLTATGSLESSACTTGYTALAAFLIITLILNFGFVLTVAVLCIKLRQKNREFTELLKHKADQDIEMKTNAVYGLSTSIEIFHGNSNVNGQDPRSETLRYDYDYITRNAYFKH